MENKTKKRTALLSKTIMAVLAAIIMLLGIAGAQEYSDRYDEIVAFHEELRNYIDMTDEYSFKVFNNECCISCPDDT